MGPTMGRSYSTHQPAAEVETATSGRLSNRSSASTSFLSSCFRVPKTGQRPYEALYSCLCRSASHRHVLKVTNHQLGGITW